MPLELEIKDYLRQLLEQRALKKKIPVAGITEEANLMDLGVLDSIAFFEIITAIEVKFCLEVSFSDVVPGAFSTLAGISAQCARGKRA